MPRRAKGPRLYLRKGRRDSRTGAALPDVWVIRDRAHERSTGCPESGLGEAERQLALYIAEKWTAEDGQAVRNRRDPAQVGVSEALTLYAMERAPKLKADPKSTAGFIAKLDEWWAGKMLSEVKRSTCVAYTAWRTKQTVRNGSGLVSTETARRELETLSAAIGYWHGEDPLTTRPAVHLPDKPESPRDALTRSQAAALLLAARGLRREQVYGPSWPNEPPPSRWVPRARIARINRAHLVRFILIGLYTGSRSGVIKALLWEESPTNAWVDLEKGMIYRRGKQERETATKRRPVVKLPPRLLAHMKRWRKKDGKISAVIHHGAEPVGKVRKSFEACVADAWLPEDVTPHWLRHTCATWLMEAGAEMWEAAAYCGMSTAVLEKHYGHHRPDYQAGAIKAAGGKR